MIWLVLTVLGVTLGSFINAFVWRLHLKNDVADTKQKAILQTKSERELSLVRGRSMCSTCGHALAVKDLIPIFSWLTLRGRCRYCRKPIEDTPLAEILLPVLFVLSYWWWPHGWSALAGIQFGLWLGLTLLFVALLLYDLKWMLLPRKLTHPLIAGALLFVILNSIILSSLTLLVDAVLGAGLIGGGFWLMYRVSNGRWIGGGDIPLAVAIGLLLGGPLLSFLSVFIASAVGLIVIVPSLIAGQRSLGSKIPFGPFLIVGFYITQFFGNQMLEWYISQLLIR